MLIHGAWHSGKVWERVAPLITGAGHRVLAPSLTGHGDRAHLLGPEVGLYTHVDDIVRLITDEDLSDVILVGHSYAGLVISSVAAELPERVGHLAHLDAMDPHDGESAVDIIPAAQSLIDQAAEADEPWRLPPLPEQPEELFGVTDPADRAWLRTILSDESVLCLQQPVRLDGLTAGILRTHIHCTGDAPQDSRSRPTAQPDSAPARVWELPTGHDRMITMPVELTDLLLELA
ncbi:alpha/beta fold hydrolase [Streptomyces sp. NPDC056600]|uniref:alpha/beta hydrolase n=1 Tax=Streptomyces sp. NPDC056600 TaxID=3345874 RepID=UPI0036771CE8